MILYSFIHHTDYDMFRPVITAIFEQCYSNIKGRTEVEDSPLQLNTS